MISKHEIAWAAGIIEGEGCPHYNGSPRLNLSMSDEDVVRRFAGLFGGTVRRVEKANKMSTKPMFVWSSCGVRAIAVMMTIYSFMGGRRKQKIREIIETWKTKRVGATSEQAKERWKVRRLSSGSSAAVVVT